MQATCALFRVFKALEDHWVLVEQFLFDGHIDSDNVLPDNPASANVQVSAYTEMKRQR